MYREKHFFWRVEPYKICFFFIFTKVDFSGVLCYNTMKYENHGMGKEIVSMVNFTARYAKVSNPNINLSKSERIVFADLRTSRADKRTDPPTYHSSDWKGVAFLGDAFEPAKALSGGELIDVVRGSIRNEQNANGEYSLSLTVFEFRLSDVKSNN